MRWWTDDERIIVVVKILRVKDEEVGVIDVNMMRNLVIIERQY